MFLCPKTSERLEVGERLHRSLIGLLPNPGRRPVQVSHVFRQYGPGVRFVHFLHKTKNRREPGGLRRTRVTDSSVSVQFRE